MAGVKPRTEDWKTLPWKRIQRDVFRLQQRIYQAERRGDHKQVRNLRLLLRSWSARCLAVRQVTQDNRGKRTPGVDGVVNLTPKQRMVLVEELKDVSNWQADSIRRTYIEKRGSTELREVIRRHKGVPQAALIKVLNPKIRGWAQYYSACVAKETFDRMDEQVFHKLYRWARFRHPRKTGGWCVKRYWKRKGERTNFGDGTAWLVKYADTSIKRHVKVRGGKSPYDGDWPYWVGRLGRDPTKPTRVINLLRRQKCRCGLCGLYFGAEDVIEMHHWDGDRLNNRYANLGLLHGHCHDEIHGRRC
jgi:5-methylcytosine-specific restriction endonuclease McrA